MELLNKEEHQKCPLYDKCESPFIVHAYSAKGDTFPLNETYNQVVFLLEGKVRLLCERINNVFEKGHFFLAPRGYKCTMNVEKNSSVVIINMHHKIDFCYHFPFEMLYRLNKGMTIDHSMSYSLRMNEVIVNYLSNVIQSLSAGLKCAYFSELKQKELLYYLRAYYPQEDLAVFFAPILNNDFYFAELIYQNFKSAKSVGDLAALANYSISGFKKRFVKVFATSPRKWLEREKAKNIYYEIKCTQKTFKEISLEYHFSSPAHFCRFCKRVYGMSSGALRENAIV